MNSLKAVLNRIKFPMMLTGIIVTVSFFVLWRLVVVTILPGQKAVFYSRMFGGTDMNTVYGEGIHLKMPWDKFFIYDARVQEAKVDLDVLSSDGLTIKVTISCRYQIMKDLLPQLHTEIGIDYFNKIIYPSLTSAVRQVVGKYRPIELYSSARQELQDQMLVTAIQEVSRVPIVIYNVIVKSITLPEIINKAIEKKLESEQEYLRYQYILQTTVEEAKRKTIEAYGINRYQELINQNMTNDFLRFEGIKATKELAASPNSKMVVIGGGKDGLPVILNTADSDVSAKSQNALKLNDAREKTAKIEESVVKETDQAMIKAENSILNQNKLIEKLKYFDKILLNPLKGSSNE
ncbi:MAG: prohibitin family protein [Alphaproteobacteria bacterium]